MSRWFQSYGYASVYDNLIVGALPLDEGDVVRLSALGVTRVLNLVQDEEYGSGSRRRVERALSESGLIEVRIGTDDFGGLTPELLEAATTQVNTWLDEGEVVYLHCRAGWQRSSAVAAGAIARRDGLDAETALRQIQRMKSTADPLPHQREDLARWLASRPENGR